MKREGHAWRKRGFIIRIVIENKTIVKRTIRRPRLRWENCVVKDVGTVKPESTIVRRSGGQE